ncbi:MAG TPA: aminomethyl-transferring glycine dehydrogenase subunit GcvPA [Trueperaceae bacterium]
MNYLPHTPEDIERALATIGVSSIEELFADVPPSLRRPEMDIPAAQDEVSLLRHLRELAAKNASAGPDFLGGGVQKHFIPAVTPALAMQSEFMTAYTPYQAEVSQGILQATFEYQSMMCELTGLDVSNASLYDGATAVAEAALLAMRHTRRSKVLVSRGVHPETREVLATYLAPLGAELQVLDLDELRTAPRQVAGDVACVIAQNPNFLGYLEDMAALSVVAREAGALFVAVCDLLSLALLRSPGEVGADVAVGDGQTAGNPLNFGGPSFGFMVVRKELVRQLPGRLAGQTRDADGRRAFVLTLQAREQHIRRSKAKSNVCTNHQLSALMAAVNLAALGPQGLREVAAAGVQSAHALAARLAKAGLDVRDEASFFNEFVLQSPLPPYELRRALAARGIRAGVPVPEDYGMGEAVTLAASELTTGADIDALVSALKDLAAAARPLEAAHG